MLNFHYCSPDCCAFFFTDTATTEIYTLSLHDALPISTSSRSPSPARSSVSRWPSAIRETSSPSWSCSTRRLRSEEHTSELQSRLHLVCRLLLEKKKRHCRKRRGTADKKLRQTPSAFSF